MANMEEFLENLATAIGQMNNTKVPPPTPYQGYGDIRAFFTSFENYCQNVYGNNTEAQLTILPSFLEGEAKQIALSFGNGAQYNAVKERIIAEMTGRRSLGSNQVSDIFSTQRREHESLLCYSIRLETMAAKIPNATADLTNIMVKSKFIASLNERIAKEINLRLGGNNNATLADIVRLATLLEDSAPGYFPNANSNTSNSTCSSGTAWPVAAIDGPAPQLPSVSGVGSWGNTNNANQNRPLPNKDIKCYGCRQPGHFKQNCTAVCTYCGKNKHLEDNCYRKREEQGYNRGQGNDRQGSNRQNNRQDGRSGRNSTNNQTPQCSFCGTGHHSLANCNKFKEQFMACNWCGATDHKSHLCPDKPGNGARSVL